MASKADGGRFYRAVPARPALQASPATQGRSEQVVGGRASGQEVKGVRLEVRAPAALLNEDPMPYGKVKQGPDLVGVLAGLLIVLEHRFHTCSMEPLRDGRQRWECVLEAFDEGG